MTVQEIVTRVRAAIDELVANNSQFLLQSEDEENLTNVIVDKIGYALQHIIETAPMEKLDDSVFDVFTQQELTSSFSIDNDLVGHVKLPADLLRIIEARLSSWSHFPEPLSDTSQVYLMQQDQYARGSWDRPVNIITYNGKQRMLEMYCARTAQDTLNFVFIRKPAAGSYDTEHMNATVACPEGLQAALIYQVAGLAMVAFREDLASSLFAIAAQYMDPDQTKGDKE